MTTKGDKDFPRRNHAMINVVHDEHTIASTPEITEVNAETENVHKSMMAEHELDGVPENAETAAAAVHAEAMCEQDMPSLVAAGKEDETHEAELDSMGKLVCEGKVQEELNRAKPPLIGQEHKSVMAEHEFSGVPEKMEAALPAVLGREQEEAADEQVMSALVTTEAEQSAIDARGRKEKVEGETETAKPQWIATELRFVSAKKELGGVSETAASAVIGREREETIEEKIQKREAEQATAVMKMVQAAAEKAKLQLMRMSQNKSILEEKERWRASKRAKAAVPTAILREQVQAIDENVMASLVTAQAEQKKIAARERKRVKKNKVDAETAAVPPPQTREEPKPPSKEDLERKKRRRMIRRMRQPGGTPSLVALIMPNVVEDDQAPKRFRIDVDEYLGRKKIRPTVSPMVSQTIAAVASASQPTNKNGSKDVGTRKRKRKQPGVSVEPPLFTVVAPPGNLGIYIANIVKSKGTVISGVLATSTLVDKISPGDRIIAIDGEDVSLMTASEICEIIVRKSMLERTLTVVTPSSDQQYRLLNSSTKAKRKKKKRAARAEQSKTQARKRDRNERSKAPGNKLMVAKKKVEPDTKKQKLKTSRAQSSSTYAEDIKSRWDNYCERLVAFKKEFGHCSVPRHWKRDKQLGEWLTRQRRQWRNKQRGEHSYLTDERLEQLREIGFEVDTTARSNYPTDSIEHGTPKSNDVSSVVTITAEGNAEEASTHKVADKDMACHQREEQLHKTIVAPPGGLGVILSDMGQSNCAVVLALLESSVLAGEIAPGDRIIAIDGEDVSLMNSSDIGSIMARRIDFERILTVHVLEKAEADTARAKSQFVGGERNSTIAKSELSGPTEQVPAPVALVVGREHEEAVGEHDISSLVASKAEQNGIAARERERTAKKQVEVGAQITKSKAIGEEQQLILEEQEAVGVQEQASGAKEPDVTSQGEEQQQNVIVAPPGSLGLVIANTTESSGTVVRSVDASSVLAEKISPGDRIIAIDGEDVSLKNVSELCDLIVRKIGSERKLTVRACVPSNGHDADADTERIKPQLMRSSQKLPTAEQKLLGVSEEAETAAAVETQQGEVVSERGPDMSSLVAAEAEQNAISARERENKANTQMKEEAERAEVHLIGAEQKVVLAEQELVGLKDQSPAIKECDKVGLSQGEDQLQKAIVAPPGRLGLLLSNMTDGRGTVVKRVNASSVLAEKISPGDRIIAIDGEDVSLMNADNIGTVLELKIGSERKLTVLAVVPWNGRQFKETEADADTERAKPQVMGSSQKSPMVEQKFGVNTTFL